MPRRLRDVLVITGVLAASACSSDIGVSDQGGPTCVSRYEDVARADSRAELDDVLVSQVDRSVVRLRLQGSTTASGDAARSADLVDLLTRKGRRVMQIEVFQLAGGQWYAGRWSQCID